MIANRQIDVEHFNGGLVVWDSGQMPFSNFADGMIAIGYPDLVPDRDGWKAEALRSTLMKFVGHYVKLPRGQAPEPVRLDSTTPSFLAQSTITTATDAVHVDILAARVDPNNKIEIFKHNPDFLPNLSAKIDAAESVFQSIFDAKRAMIPASKVTHALNTLLLRKTCLPLTKQGRVYAVPSMDTTNLLEIFAGHVPNDSQFSLGVGELHLPPTSSMFTKIATSCKAELESKLKEVEKQVQTAGDKARKNGAKARYDALEKVKDYVSEFSSVLDETQSKFLTESAERLQKTISATTVLDILS